MKGTLEQTQCLRSHICYRILICPRNPLYEKQTKKLAWFEYVIRHDSLSKTILQGTLEGGRRCGRLRKCWMDNVEEWTSLPVPELLTMASRNEDWKGISAELPSCPHSVEELN